MNLSLLARLFVSVDVKILQLKIEEGEDEFNKEDGSKLLARL